MAYDATKPEDTGFLSEAPTELRNNFKGLKEDQIVDAALLKGLAPGNTNGQIPVNNGTECENLNAAMLSGKTPSDFAPKVHTHDIVTTSSDGFMTAPQNNKLAGIAAGAEVNQVAFSNILVGDTTIQADSKTDTLEMVAGENISITPDATNDKVTISSTYNIVSTTSAGLAPICDGSTTNFLRADATWSTPIPIGLIMMWPGSITSIPTGWNLCNGSAVSRIDYAILFSVIGTTFGAGDGSTTFNLPDLRNRLVAGAGNNYAVGATGGEASHTLTWGEMPVHAHTATGWTDSQGAHTHTFSQMYQVSGAAGNDGAGIFRGNTTTGTTSSAGAHSHNVGVSVQNSGSGAAHNNMPPYCALAYIIRIA